MSSSHTQQLIESAVSAYHGADRESARRLCQKALVHEPQQPFALNLLAVLTMEDEHFEQALDLFDRILENHPTMQNALGNRQECMVRMMRRSDPWLRLAYHYFQTGRMAKAVAVYLEAIAQGAGSDIIHGNLGAHLQDLGDWGEAEHHYRAALAFNPEHVGTLYNLGHLLSLQHRHQAAEELLRLAITVNPQYGEAYLALGHLLAQAGALDESLACFDTASRVMPDSALPHTAKLFNLAYSPTVTAQDMYDLATRAVAPLAQATAPQTTPRPPTSSSSGSKAAQIIHIGFVSGDLKDHPVGYFTENLLRHADKTKFAWHIFSNFEASDPVATSLRTLASSWTNIAGQNDDAAAALIASKHIDVLFDLSGHTALNRLPLFARRAAPVQISWLGWHDTTGLRVMDYLLTDPASMPPIKKPDGSPYLSERPLFLPRTHLCMMPPSNAPDVAPAPMLQNGFITFGSMQVLAKLSDLSLKLWARILSQAPSARLMIRTKQFRDADVVSRFRIKAQAHGLPMERVLLLPPLGRGDYLASYADIDILLDSFPYPGGTTTAEALWMGVPTITLGGDTMISRQGASLLTAAGLPDWIATSPDDYLAKALYWAHHPTELQALRSGLRQRVVHTPLFDGDQFARDFEAAVLWGIDNIRAGAKG